MDKRNRSNFACLNVKPITGMNKSIGLGDYNPGHYLEPYQLNANNESGRKAYDKMADSKHGASFGVRKHSNLLKPGALAHVGANT